LIADQKLPRKQLSHTQALPLLLVNPRNKSKKAARNLVPVAPLLLTTPLSKFLLLINRNTNPTNNKQRAFRANPCERRQKTFFGCGPHVKRSIKR
jgi:hypothetical protein